MIPIVEEKESPNPPSAPVVDGGPSYILGPALYPSSGTEEQGDEGMSQGGEDARERTELEGEAGEFYSIMILRQEWHGGTTSEENEGLIPSFR